VPAQSNEVCAGVPLPATCNIVTGVGFVYTAVKAKFTSTLKGLDAPGLCSANGSGRKRVDDLDTGCLNDRFQTR
jgi:hypothetical protein